MDVESLAKQLILQNMTPEQQKAVLESIRQSLQKTRELKKQKVGENAQLVVQALKKIEADIRAKYDNLGNKIEQRVASIKDGKDGKDGKNGANGRDGRDGMPGPIGPKGKDGLNGRDGKDGEDGVSVTDAHIDFDGSLIISLSSGRTINVGEVVAPDLTEKIKIIANGGGTSQEVLDTLASLQTQINNLIPSQTGNSGKFLTTNGTALSWASVPGALTYKGTWNASTNTPALASGVGFSGDYYVVATAGSTNLDGITDWLIGDWLLFNGATWQKIDQTNTVTSVNGQTGAVSLTTTNINEGTNLYYLDSRARQALSAGTGITYSNTTGVITNAAPDQVVALTGAGTTSISGTYPNFTITSNDQYQGTVTSVGVSVPTGLSVSNTPITSSGTIAIALASGYSIPTTSSQTNWDTAYTDRLKWDGGSTGLNATTGRTSLGLGTIATQDANNVSISGGTINGTSIGATTASSGAFTSITSTSASGVLTRQAATQDGVQLLGRAGGTSSWEVTLTPTTLSADRTLTLPNVSGTVITTGDSGTVTSTMIANGTIVNGDISASAAIAVSKLSASTISGVTLGNNLATLTMNTSGTGLSGSTTYNGSGAATFTVASNATNANTASTIVARDASGNFSAGTITATLSGNATNVTGTVAVANGGTGSTSLTANNVLLGNGTSALQVVAPGANGNVLTSNGTTWVSSTPVSGGTVTSVAQTFTGGLISVAGSPITTSGTLALTVAGTSGGVPYFSSASTWASSGVLTANALVVGGGAGSAPSTITTGTGVVTALGVNTGTAGAFVVNGGALGTPSSGTVTNLTGTASININGTVGATTPNTGAFTTLSASTSATVPTKTRGDNSTNAASTAYVDVISGTASSVSFRNRIINGDMRIDQRNAGASVTVNTNGNFYAVDRFFSTGQNTDGVFTAQRSTVAPAGFTNSLIATVTTADASLGATQQYLIGQNIEGFNVADFGWGAVGAQTVTLSFWVRSSLTGTFGGSIMNSGLNRSYPFTYTISAANTFEYKTVTIAGDTSGTWLTDNGVGLRVFFSLGAGASYLGTAGSWSGSYLAGATGQTQIIATNGATFYITGVQLEAGSVATPFERRAYGTELQLCMRYCQKFAVFPVTGFDAFESYYGGTNAVSSVKRLTVPMRTTPTATFINGGVEYYSYGGVWTATTLVASISSEEMYYIYGASDGDGRGKLMRNNGGGAAQPIVTFSAEL